MNPSQTQSDTATEIISRSGRSDRPLTTVRDQVQQAVVVARHLKDPKIAQARNASEAHSLILKSEEERLRSIIASRTIAAAPQPVEIRHADLFHLLPRLDSGYVDLILCDPPYGIDAGASGFRGRTVHHHNYDDSLDEARRIVQTILIEGFRVTKPRANLFLFTDIKHWEWLLASSANAGWTPFRTPVIWRKSESEGLAPWGASGFRRTYDFIFYATKGEKGLLHSPVDILDEKRVARNERIHAAEKPEALLRFLIEASTMPGDFVLDPCCGSGASIAAAKSCARRGLGIEKDETFFHSAMANVFGKMEEKTGAES